jgi:hypothetical protein
MADIVQGKDVILSVLIDSVFYPILCATDCSLNVGREKIEKTGPTSGGVRQWAIRLEQYTSTVSGATKIANSSAAVTWFYMLQKGQLRAEMTFKLTFTDPSGASIAYEGPGLIGDQNISGPVSDAAAGSIEILWNGAPATDIIDPPVPPTVHVIYLDFPAGDTSVTSATLIGADVLEVDREGLGADPEVSTPSAGTRQFSFDAATGQIVFDAANPSNGERLRVLYQI